MGRIHSFLTVAFKVINISVALNSIYPMKEITPFMAKMILVLIAAVSFFAGITNPMKGKFDSIAAAGYILAALVCLFVLLIIW
jgi:hypothetical protein